MLSGCNRTQGNSFVSCFLNWSSRRVVACRCASRWRLTDFRRVTTRVSRRVAQTLRVFVLPRLGCSATRSLPASRCVSARVAAGAAASGRWRWPVSPPVSRPKAQRPTMSHTGIYPDIGAPQHLCTTAVTGTATVFYCEPVFVTHPQLVASIIPNNTRFRLTGDRFSGCVSVAHRLSRAPWERIFSKVELGLTFDPRVKAPNLEKCLVSPKPLKPTR